MSKPTLSISMMFAALLLMQFPLRRRRMSRITLASPSDEVSGGETSGSNALASNTDTILVGLFANE